MTDSSEQRLLYSEALRFLTALTIDGECPMCNTNLWNISIDTRSPILCLLTPSGLGSENGRSNDLPMDCENCGFVRRHRVSAIVKWLNANPAVESEKDDI